MEIYTLKVAILNIDINIAVKQIDM